MAAQVRLVHALDGQHAGAERGITGHVSLRRRLAQRAGRRRVPAGLDVHERELPQDVRGQALAARGPRRRQRLVQDHGAFTVEAAQGVHERRAERPEHVGQQQRIPGPLGLLGRAAQGLDAGVGRARVQGRPPGPQQRSGDHAGPQPSGRRRRRGPGRGP